jgi:hypothetical protein
MSEETRDDRYADVETGHLEDVEDGCGCTEIWEHTSDRAARTGGASPDERAPDAASCDAPTEDAPEESAEAEASD